MSKVLTSGIIILILLGISNVPSTGVIETDHVSSFFDEGILYVGGTGPNNYSRIQDAINASNPGDIIFVYSGTYYENIAVNKSIQLLGENKITTTIDGTDVDNVVDVFADGVTISGFTISNSSSWPHIGMKIYSYNNNTITGNIMSDNYYGIRLEYSSNNNYIANNTINDNNYRGIFFYDSHNNTIVDNIISSNFHNGIHLRCSNNNIIIGNSISGNSKSAIYLEINSDNNSIINNDMTDNWNGISVDSSNNNTVTGNTMNSHVSDGIELLSSSNNNIVTSNVFSANNHGIDIILSRYNNITDNTISDNLYGIVLGTSYYNTISNNMFFNDGIAVSNSYCNIVANNLVNGKPLLYLEDESDIIIDVAGEAGQAVLVNCTNITIEDQELTLTANGIELWNSHYCHILNNNISNNSDGIYLHGLSSHNTISGNILNSNSWDGISSFSCSDNTIIGNTINSNYWHGIYLRSSDRNTIDSNILSQNNNQGIYSRDSYNNIIISSIFTGNNDGLYILASGGNTIGNNTINSNTECGIWFSLASCNNFVTGNTIANHQRGISVSVSSNNNHIYHNNFLSNTENAYDPCTNTWDDGYPSGGNYWDDYNGEDNYQGPNQDISGSDGIGDTIYDIPGESNQDRYPFMNSSDPGLIVDADGPYYGAVSEEVQFTGIATGGVPPYTWHWDFGNGDTSNEQCPRYAYNEAGEYNVTLTVTDIAGDIDEDETTATITELPCSIEIEIVGGIGVTATITNTGEEDIADLEWSMILEGGLIIFGKEKSGTVDIAAGESVNAKSFVFGIGKPTITVKAGCAEKITTGMVILIFFLGVQ